MKKLYSLFVIILTLFGSTKAQTYTRLFGKIFPDTTVDYFNIIDAVTDANGNSYVTGNATYANDEYYQTHLFLTKINAEGVQEWTRYFSNKGDSIDASYSVALDASNNIYVTGKRIDTFCNICTYNTKISDIITMKYDANGNRIWLNRFHDSAYKLAQPADIKIAANGTILITANETRYVLSVGTYYNTLLIQTINKNGVTTGVKKMENIVTSAGCFDNEGNIIIAGASDPDHLYQTRKPMILKFAANRNLLWSNIFDEPGKNGSFDFVACDSLNNIYTNGQTDTLTFFNNPRIITAKYNASGQRQWFQKGENQTNTAPHYWGDFIIDASGNSYTTGYISRSDVNEDWVTTKYNNNGTKIFTAYYDDASHGPDEPISIALKGDKLCVNGYAFAGNGNYAITTVAYDNINGKQLGVDIFKQGNSNGFAAGLGFDKSGNLYSIGSIGSFNYPYPAFAVIKYGLQKKGLENIKPEKLNITLYPNPVTTSLNVSFTSSILNKDYKCFIYDVSGNLYSSANMNNNEGKYNAQINTANLHAGLYTIKISDGITIESRTFLKQ